MVDQVEKGRYQVLGVRSQEGHSSPWQLRSETCPSQLISGTNSIRSRVAAMPMPLPSDSSTRTTEASQRVHPPEPNPKPGGNMMTSSSFEPALIPDSE